MSADIEVTHVGQFGEPRPWAWNGKPSAKDLHLSGGRAEVRAAAARFPIGARVRWHQASAEWVVESLHIVGSRSPSESWAETDFPGDKRFRVALADAVRRVREVLQRVAP